MKNIIVKNDNRFKSVFVTVNLLLPLVEGNMGKNALLALVLKKSSSKYKTEKELEKALASAYNASVDMFVEKVNNLYKLSFGIEILNVKYLDKESIEEIKEIIYSIICTPNIQNGLFDESVFELEKQSLIKKIEEEKDDKRRYAIKRLEQEMFKGTPYSESALGTVESVKKITNEDLVRHLEYVYKEAFLQVTAVGNFAGMEDMPNEIYTKISGYCGKDKLEIKEDVERKITEIKTTIDKQDVNQSVLCIGLVIPNAKKEDMYKSMLYSTVLGGTPASKLFQNVREKESLAYFSKAQYNRQKNVIYTFSGIAPEMYEKAKEVMLEQVDLLKAGEITDIEFNAAKQSLISSYKELSDTKITQAKTLLANEIYFGKTVDFNEMIKEIEKLEKEDIIEIAKKVKVSNIYLLGGVSDAN